MAINIYLDVKKRRLYPVGHRCLNRLGVPCRAPLIVGFDVCGAIDALIAVGGQWSAWLRLYRRLTTVAEWVSELLGAVRQVEAQPTTNPSKVLLDYF